MNRILRCTDVRSALASRVSSRRHQRGFILDPYRFAAPAETDPFFSDVTFLLTGTGTVGNEPVDMSPLANPLNNTAGVINSATSVGTSPTSVYWGTGANSWRVQLTNTYEDAYDFAGGNFTIEFLGVGGTGGTDRAHFSAWGARFLLRWSGNTLQFFTNFSSPMFSVSSTYSSGTLEHVCVVRSGNDWGIARNGTWIGTTTNSTSISSSTGDHLAVSSTSAGDAISGNWLHRITKAARYTPGVGFTSPTNFPTS